VGLLVRSWPDESSLDKLEDALAGQSVFVCECGYGEHGEDIPNLLLTSKKNMDSNGDMDDFETWWSRYPRKRSKGDARKAWLQTDKIRPPLIQMLKALAVAKASPDWTKDGGIYIPYPATYLRAEAWADVHEIEIEQVQPDGKMWWESNSGIERKARELGQEWDSRIETWLMFVERIKRIAKVVPIQEAKQVSK
jgi:hypothetical protein